MPDYFSSHSLLTVGKFKLLCTGGRLALECTEKVTELRCWPLRVLHAASWSNTCRRWKRGGLSD